MTETNLLEGLLARLFKPREPVCLSHGEDATTTPSLHIAALPSDMTKLDLTADLDKIATKLQPWRRTGTARLADLDSLITWANRHKGPTSALFAKVTSQQQKTPDGQVSSILQPELTCIADYIGSGAPVIDATSRDPNSSHMQHRGTYAFPLSAEWKIWTAISGTAMSGPELGEFVEANAKDLLDPTPNILEGRISARDAEQWEIDMIQIARQISGRFGQYQTLIQLARNFQVHEVSNVSASMNRDSGESAIQFLNEHQQPDGSPVSIPNLFMIAIPVFEHGAAYRIPVRFRYRKAGASVKFIFTLHNADVCFRDAVDEALARASSETGLPLFRGSPETTA